MSEEKKEENVNLVPIIVLIGIGIALFILFGKFPNKNEVSNTSNLNNNIQQEQIDDLKNEIEILKQKENTDSKTITRPTNNDSNTTNKKSTAEIVKEWRNSTAYIDCYWGYVSDANPYGLYLKTSGSGLIAMVDSIPTVITNKHVVSSTQYGTAEECNVTTPNNSSFYTILPNGRPEHTFLRINLPKSEPFGKIKFLDNGSDVAFLSNFKETDKTTFDKISSNTIKGLAKSGNFACNSEPNIGDPLLILGFPSYGSGAGTAVSSINEIELTATEGIIAGNDNGYYTTSAKIEHGNSGGLAIDKNRNCYLGIPTASFSGEIESLGRILPSFVYLK